MYTAQDFQKVAKARVIKTGEEYQIAQVIEQDGNVTLNLIGYAEDGGNANIRVSVGEKVFVEPVVEDQTEEEEDDFLAGEDEDKSESPELTVKDRWIALGLPADTFASMPEEAALVIINRLEKPNAAPKKNWRDGKLGTYWRKGKYLTETEFESQFGFNGLEMANEFVKIVSGANGSRKPKSDEVNTHLIDGIKVTITRLQELLNKMAEK